VQLRILQEAQKDFYARREYNDVDSYYNVTDSGKLGAKIQGPVLGSVSKDSSGRWNIQINDKDNRASWSAVAAATYGNNPSLARSLLNSTMILNEAEIGELNKAVVTGDTRSLSQATRRSLANLSNLAFKGKVSVAEIIQKQVGTYYGNQFLPPNLRERSLQLERVVRPAAAVTGDTFRDIGIKITNWNHGHSDNRAVDFTLVRNNGQISNPVPAPVSGRILFAGNKNDGFGNTIVIVADQDGPGYKKGDRIRIAHLAQLYFQTGNRITRGRPIGKSGDASPHDSVPGRSGTGAGDPGHVHIQIYKPGSDIPYSNSQYGQAYQNSFVRQNLVPLFKR
jgi:murein DD-endopeptidase MepM/ murein hydrolase activator NlpD